MQDSKSVNCQNCKQDFVIEPDDFAFYEKMKVPAPTWCPECRLQRRLVWRNERVLSRGVCDLCGAKTISTYSQKTPFPVYCAPCWRSDKWDALKYGREYDFNKPFFAQFLELFNVVPRPAISQNGTNVNSEHSNMIQDVKNVYMSFSVITGSENVYYSANVNSSKEVIDGFNITDGELLYECMDAQKSYNCAYIYWSKSCVNSRFLLDCNDCQDCFGCVGLRGKSYYIFNEPYSKEEYVKKLEEYDLKSFVKQQEIEQHFWEFSQKFPRRFARMINSVNSTGDGITNSRNAKYAFNVSENENVKYVLRCPQVKDSMDVNHKGDGQLVYEHALGGSMPGSNLICILYGSPGINHVSYSDYCGSSSDLFGCVGVKGKSYAILNRLYSKEEYEALVPKIIEHMNAMPYTDKQGRVYKFGEFFPPQFSPFAYNETVANEYFPKSKDEALALGSTWKEVKHNEYEITKEADELPDNVKDATDQITKEIIRCSKTSRAYKILPEELAFYQRMNVPLPRLHPDERHRQRFLKRNPLKLWHRKCAKCSNEFETSYAPDRPEIVYCETCYQQEVI
ncbi:MAG: hypothetical protein EXS48_02835 [Candidatus Staskawiczbacteria bacterium]|nr:hypothetical protein [Candidatus Staskawiczbacteria bacterium]